jgi:hypothetical protein
MPRCQIQSKEDIHVQVRTRRRDCRLSVAARLAAATGQEEEPDVDALIEFAETLKVKVGEMFTKLVQCAALNWKLFGTNPSFRLLHCERAMAWATFGGTF